jgi:hypothetical protein
MIAGLLTGIAASPWARAALRYGAIVVAVLLFLLSLRRSGERTGHLAERPETTEKANDVQRQVLETAARRPRDRGDGERPRGDAEPGADMRIALGAMIGYGQPSARGRSQRREMRRTRTSRQARL